jgi:hypothetical protein
MLAGLDFRRLTSSELAELDALLARADQGERLTEEEHQRCDELADKARTRPRPKAKPRRSWSAAFEGYYGFAVSYGRQASPERKRLPSHARRTPEELGFRR